ncbi:MAG TPA: hypothetical protein VMC79_06545, partial [Rectinemataceae bacterium]|nr:hypothetical protein [Rectinemataceae bacterium]
EWRQRRSAFCSAATAPAAFRTLLEAVDARYVLLSYNSEGILSVEELYDLLAERAVVELRSLGYLTYRGGRQSALRRIRNREILFVAERREARGKPSTAEGRQEPRDGRRATVLESHEAELRLGRAIAGPFYPGLLLAECEPDGLLRVCSGDRELRIRTYRGLLLEPEAAALTSCLTSAEKLQLARRLEPALVDDNGTACELCAGLIEEGASDSRIQRLALAWLRKLAHKKYEIRFLPLMERLQRAAETRPGELHALRLGVAELHRLFRARAEAAIPIPGPD